MNETNPVVDAWNDQGAPHPFATFAKGWDAAKRDGQAQPSGNAGELPSDDALLAFASEEQFFLFCSEDEFLDIAKSVLQRFAHAQPPVSQALPERDPAKSADQQGLFRKFEVHRTDGSDLAGGKHHGCRYFVLDVDHDPHAKAALTAYAAACESTHPALARDLREKWGAGPVVNQSLTTDDLPPLPKGYIIQMTPDPDSTPAQWFDETDMREYARAALAQQAGGQDREDAERWRYIRDVPRSEWPEDVRCAVDLQQNAVMDERVDAARAAAKEAQDGR